MIDHQTYKDRRDAILNQFRSNTKQTETQLGYSKGGIEEYFARQEANLAEAQKAIDSLFIDVIGEDEKYVKIDPVKNVEVSIVNQVFSELRTIVKGK